jgi:hypothetical protein
MMLPWIIVGWLRAVVGAFLFITVFAFPMGSCAQIFLFASHSIYFGELIFLQMKLFNAELKFVFPFFSNDRPLPARGVLQLQALGPD